MSGLSLQSTLAHGRAFAHIAAFHPELTAFRRDLHAHPELCFQEQRTSDLVAAKLTEWGIAVHRGLGTTGVVGIVKAGNSPRSIALRAEAFKKPKRRYRNQI